MSKTNWRRVPKNTPSETESETHLLWPKTNILHGQENHYYGLKHSILHCQKHLYYGLKNQIIKALDGIIFSFCRTLMWMYILPVTMQLKVRN